MSLLAYEPFYEFDRLLDNVLPTRITPSNALQHTAHDGSQNLVRTLKPRMDLHEDTKDNKVTATFELPGLKKEDVSIDLNNNRLTISGESKSSEKYEESGWAVKERRFGKFSRTLQVPDGVKEDQIKASLQDGVLSVSFPRAPAEKTPKRISVN